MWAELGGRSIVRFFRAQAVRRLICHIEELGFYSEVFGVLSRGMIRCKERRREISPYGMKFWVVELFPEAEYNGEMSYKQVRLDLSLLNMRY